MKTPLHFTMKVTLVVALVLANLVPAFPADSVPTPKGTSMTLQLRTRALPFRGGSDEVEANFSQTFPTANTAIIITDMWDKHWCTDATVRVGEIARKMEPLLERARASGILIIHAPSETMKFYANAPGRELAETAPLSVPPQGPAVHDAPVPVDDHDGGCTSRGDVRGHPWSRETPLLTIKPGDVISDKGPEIYNVLRQHHIDTVIFMGVHANICILNRSFGIRQLTQWGIRCLLVRDLTDVMYDSASPPYVSHEAGTELVVEYIERYLAPTLTSAQMLSALPRQTGHRSAPGH
jgi:nicotinamidase-related amidase